MTRHPRQRIPYRLGLALHRAARTIGLDQHLARLARRLINKLQP